jgi:hypothetical protein
MDSQSLESIEQIKWEHEHIHKCKWMMFWFCEETLCPITLFELGVAVTRSNLPDNRLFIGAHPGYQRKLDVEIQVGLARPHRGGIYTSLDNMVQDIIIASKT